MIGYLIGLILAFQSALPLRRFGAELFVVNAVALSLLRELGPLLAGVLLAGRTGSAYAAELGTMKVNEELAALETMGLSPMTLLVLPRLFAATLVTPVMALLLEIAGLAGMLTVLMAFGFPLAGADHATAPRRADARPVDRDWRRRFASAPSSPAIGCRVRARHRADGARAVGQSATRAVVGGIVASIVAGRPVQHHLLSARHLSPPASLAPAILARGPRAEISPAARCSNHVSFTVAPA